MDLLTKANYVSPKTIAPSILSLLEHDPLIKSLQLEKKISTDIKKVNGMVRSLDELTLLTSLMRTIPLPDLQFEKLFVAMRRFVLTNLDQLKTSSELINFLSTLSLHCFVNEYVYAESDEEFCLIKELENKIMQTITQSEQPKAINLLCLASYRPLHQYNWCDIPNATTDGVVCVVGRVAAMVYNYYRGRGPRPRSGSGIAAYYCDRLGGGSNSCRFTHNNKRIRPYPHMNNNNII